MQLPPSGPTYRQRMHPNNLSFELEDQMYEGCSHFIGLTGIKFSVSEWPKEQRHELQISKVVISNLGKNWKSLATQNCRQQYHY